MVNSSLEKIKQLTTKLEAEYQPLLTTDPKINRVLVSFQGNKKNLFYRWYKYKEGFSADLVEYLCQKYQIESPLLDPFAGIGTTMFVGRSLGMDVCGIELLPSSQKVIEAKNIILTTIWQQKENIASELQPLDKWLTNPPAWLVKTDFSPLNEIKITAGAYPEKTKLSLEKYLATLKVEKPFLQAILLLALLNVLEEVSFTRKDGQYLRWDFRASRKKQNSAAKFDKGKIADFEVAVQTKIQEIKEDILTLSQTESLLSPSGTTNFEQGSCLNLLPLFPANTYGGIITSPPYCNRYDYTRTYALELALLGYGETEVASLRQTLLSSTVENRVKDLLQINPAWQEVLALVEKQDLLQEILTFLEEQKKNKNLNNAGIPRMIRGYFTELACILSECQRVLKPEAKLIMVNDNVRYAGISIPVDLILSDLAKKLGFQVKEIIVLAQGKGNSSQQMDLHGKENLRKCIYVWEKI